jgi:hypothetical protein
VLNILRGGQDFLNSKGIKYDLSLSCDRDRDLNDFRNYNRLDDSLKIVRYIKNTDFDKDLSKYSEYYVFTFNDSIIISTSSYDSLLNILKRMPK